MASLLVDDPQGGPARIIPLRRNFVALGASEDADVRIDAAEAEETHAMIRLVQPGNQHLLEVIPPAQALRVNGKAVTRQALINGDVVELGTWRARYLTEEGLFTLARADHGTDTTSEVAKTYQRILQVSRNLLAHVESESLLNELLDGALEITDAAQAFIVLKADDERHVVAARDARGAALDNAEDLLSDSVLRKVFDSGKALMVKDASADAEFSASVSVVRLSLTSIICVPLVADGRLLGALHIGNGNRVGLFTERHLEVMQIFAAQASLILSSARTISRLRRDNSSLREALETQRSSNIVGSCNALTEVLRKVDRVARTDVSILIRGETGTGKELIAREIHVRSERQAGPFVAINCGAIPAELLESELFGHVQGAFTGAHSAKVGRFQQAHRGTLFLDEIGEMPLALQVKLLRALQEKAVTRVGATSPEKVDFRVVAATHRHLEEAIAAGAFREDLYYRLNVVTLTLPPLRERDGDILLLARHFVDRYVQEYATGPKAMSNAALKALQRATWPGNIRQLENHIRKAVLLGESDVIDVKDLDLAESELRQPMTLAEAREAWQRRYILEALELNDGNRTATARELGVDPRTVFRFLEKEGERRDDDVP